MPNEPSCQPSYRRKTRVARQPCFAHGPTPRLGALGFFRAPTADDSVGNNRLDSSSGETRTSSFKQTCSAIKHKYCAQRSNRWSKTSVSPVLSIGINDLTKESHGIIYFQCLLVSENPFIWINRVSSSIFRRQLVSSESNTSNKSNNHSQIEKL